MFESSENTEQLDEALAKAQGEIDSAIKNATNPHFKSSYANLAAVYEACRESLSKHGITHTQWLIHTEDQRLHILTRLAHKGQWMRSTSSIPVSKADAQGYGSATTYLRRYALMAAVGIPQDDDDGNAAAAAKPNTQPTKPKVDPPAAKPTFSNSAPGSIDPKQRIAIEKLAKDKNIDLIMRLDPKHISILSQVEATELWKELNKEKPNN